MSTTMYDDTLFISGGIGDFLAVLSHYPKRPKRIKLATTRAGLIAELCRSLEIEVEVIDSQRTYFHKWECEARHGEIGGYDGSITPFFREIKEGKHTFQGSEFLKIPLEDKIWARYALIVPATTGAVTGRNMTHVEFKNIVEKTELPIIVSQHGDWPVPKSKRIYDLSNQTTLIESVALVKYATEIYTIDTWQAHLACQLPVPVWIKSRNPQYWENKHAYCAGAGENVKVIPWMEPL